MTLTVCIWRSQGFELAHKSLPVIISASTNSLQWNGGWKQVYVVTRSTILVLCENTVISRLVSISQTFYAQRFCKQVFCADFLYLQFVFVIFWQKKIGKKASHKMLVKLTTGVCSTKLLFTRPRQTKDQSCLKLDSCKYEKDSYLPWNGQA